MAARDPVIEVQIRTSADVTGVDKATASLNKLEGVGDELTQQTARTKAAFDALEASIKGAGDASEATGEKMAQGAQKGAGAAGALSKLGGVIDVAQAGKDAAEAGFNIGKTFGDAFVRVMENGWDWKKFLGGDDFDAGIVERKRALQGLRDEARQLRDELEKRPGGGLLDYMADLKAAVSEVSKEMAAQKEIQDAQNKAADAQDEDKAAGDKRAIEEDVTLSKEEKIRKLAALEDEQDINAFNKREARRQQELENQTQEMDLAMSEQDKANAAAAEAKKRQDVAQKAEEDERFQRSKAGGASDEQLDIIRKQIGEREGVKDLGSFDEERGVADKAESAAQAARQRARDEARQSRTLVDRQDIERGEDQRQLGSRRDQRGQRTEREVGKAQAEGAGEDLKAATEQAKNATKATEEGGDKLADGLKELADMVGNKDKAMAAALDQMAADLADGASTEELAKISAAMKVVAQSSNKAFADLGKAVDNQTQSIEQSAKMAADALKRTEALKAQIRSMKTAS